MQGIFFWPLRQKYLTRLLVVDVTFEQDSEAVLTREADNTSLDLLSQSRNSFFVPRASVQNPLVYSCEKCWQHLSKSSLNHGLILFRIFSGHRIEDFSILDSRRPYTVWWVSIISKVRLLQAESPALQMTGQIRFDNLDQYSTSLFFGYYQIVSLHNSIPNT